MIAAVMPPVCPGCAREALWTSVQLQHVLSEAYVWTEADRAFLVALFIAPE